MVQIISDRQSDWVNWIGEVIARLGEFPKISRMMVVADIADIDDTHAQIIEFMNCSTDDVYHMGATLQKEAIKHEFAEDFGLEDDWEYDDDDKCEED